jgi:hypothetical protein
MPLSTLRLTPRGATRKTQGQDGVALSFPVGILPPLQHAGLSRRTLGQDSNLQPFGSIKKDVKRKSSPCELKPLKFSASSPVPRAQTVIDVAQLMMPDMVVSEPSFPS